MNAEFIKALDALEIEKNIDKEDLIEAIESSIASAYKKNYGSTEEVEVNIDRESGEISVYATKDIVDEVENPQTQISLEKAREQELTYELGDVYKQSVTPKDFGRIAAQNAKQLIVQKIKEAERAAVYDEFIERQEEMVNGQITRVERGTVFVDIGNGEGIMPSSEQSPGDTYTPSKRMKVYILAVKKAAKGPLVTVSRTHPGLVKRLFEEEVPEIYDGVVEIESIAREAGSRTKIAVKANDPAVDPLGACVGQRGIRVQSIINELSGEKLDIIKYSDNIEEYLANALSPAKVEKIVPNLVEKTAIAVVDDLQLSLAIGKEGQNVRLAARLTSWKIDIKNRTDFGRMLMENPNFEKEYRGELKALSADEDILSQMEEDSLDEVLERDLDSELAAAGGDDLFTELDEVAEDDLFVPTEDHEEEPAGDLFEDEV